MLTDEPGGSWKACRVEAGLIATFLLFAVTHYPLCTTTSKWRDDAEKARQPGFSLLFMLARNDPEPQ
jgi:hypothetical protein